MFCWTNTLGDTDFHPTCIRLCSTDEEKSKSAKILARKLIVSAIILGLQVFLLQIRGGAGLRLSNHNYLLKMPVIFDMIEPLTKVLWVRYRIFLHEH